MLQRSKQERRGGIEIVGASFPTKGSGRRSRNAVVALKLPPASTAQRTRSGSRNAVVALKLFVAAFLLLQSVSEAGTPWWH